MAARRLGIETDGALAKVRRVLPDRLRLGVESLEHTLGFTGRGRADAARRRDAADARRGRPPRPPASRPLHGLGGRRRPRATSRPYGLVAHSGRWYVAAFDHLRDDLAHAARRPLRATSGSPARRKPPPPGFDADRLRQPLARPRPLDSTGSRSLLHTDLGHRARSASRPRSPSSSPRGDGTLLRLRADSLDWAAGLLAGAGCDFTVIPRSPPRAARQRRETPRAATQGQPSRLRRPSGHFFHRVDGAEERAALFAGVLDLLGGQGSRRRRRRFGRWCRRGCALRGPCRDGSADAAQGQRDQRGGQTGDRHQPVGPVEVGQDGAAPMIAISTEMPSTAPSWRKQDEIAEPVAKRAGGRSATAAELQPANDSPTPIPVRIVAGRNSRHVRGVGAQPGREQHAAEREQQPAGDAPRPAGRSGRSSAPPARSTSPPSTARA